MQPIIDRVKYDSTSDEVLVFKFPGEELKLGSQLIVNQSQEAVFVKGGEACDVFPPGTHTLATGNLPLLSKVVDLPFGRQTPFSAEVWFVSKTVKRDLRWDSDGDPSSCARDAKPNRDGKPPRTYEVRKTWQTSLCEESVTIVLSGRFPNSDYKELVWKQRGEKPCFSISYRYDGLAAQSTSADFVRYCLVEDEKRDVRVARLKPAIPNL
jgi:hypothetical protein